MDVGKMRYKNKLFIHYSLSNMKIICFTRIHVTCNSNYSISDDIIICEIRWISIKIIPHLRDINQ